MENTKNHTKNIRYLFFLSQDYSFPILRPLQEAIIHQGDQVRWFLYGNEINIHNLHTDEIQLKNIKEVLQYYPHVVIVPGNVVPSFIPGLKVEVFHGLPSKKIKKSGQIYHYIIRGMFDLYCTQGPSSTSKFISLSKKYKYFYVQETGWSKLDPLFPIEPISKEIKVKSIFFASTFSPRFTKAKTLYPFILHMIKKYNYHWYITLHPKIDEEVLRLYRNIKAKNITFIASTQVIQYFKLADIMLCDTSSIMYEFLSQKKPVITFQTQEEEASIINIKNIYMLESTLVSVLNNLHKYQGNIAQEVIKFHPYFDGLSSYRVLDIIHRMLNGDIILSQKKPLNIIRNMKLRKELKYWKFI
ncbi:MAG: CDP-glycerol glycerophosphotransferase family protein [Sulfurovum sp.]|nr:CDP-glycerol glycerophosphotransferase family protein [Sulfurovum sp.]